MPGSLTLFPFRQFKLTLTVKWSITSSKMLSFSKTGTWPINVDNLKRIQLSDQRWFHSIVRISWNLKTIIEQVRKVVSGEDEWVRICECPVIHTHIRLRLRFPNRTAQMSKKCKISSKFMLRTAVVLEHMARNIEAWLWTARKGAHIALVCHVPLDKLYTCFDLYPMGNKACSGGESYTHFLLLMYSWPPDSCNTSI